MFGLEGGGLRDGGVGGSYQPGVYVPLKALFLVLRSFLNNHFEELGSGLAYIGRGWKYLVYQWSI